MLTSRTSMAMSGTFEPKRRVMPSSGCTRITRAFWPSSSVIGGVERQVRRAEHHGDLGDPAAQTVFRCAGRTARRPSAAGVDLDRDGGEGLGGRGLRIPPRRAGRPPSDRPASPAVYWPRAVFWSNGSARRAAGEHLDLLGAQLVGWKHRLLHRGQRQQLQQVVLDDVAGRADAVVIVAGASPDADVLGHGDLHMVDVVGFHIGSNSSLANRSARMFCTVSLPR